MVCSTFVWDADSQTLGETYDEYAGVTPKLATLEREPNISMFASRNIAVAGSDWRFVRRLSNNAAETSGRTTSNVGRHFQVHRAGEHARKDKSDHAEDQGPMEPTSEFLLKATEFLQSFWTLCLGEPGHGSRYVS